MSCLAMIPALALTIVPAHAQSVPHPDARVALNAALIRLNHNPRDFEALIAAGNAALATGETDAALGFFTRADQFAPGNPRIAAGLASAKVRGEDPFSAIPLFIAAEKGGPLSPEMLGDRGLAYDLIGDNANAQQCYRQALTAGGIASSSTSASAEVSRRLALSLAIAGDRRGSETVLSSLLQTKDRAAWRTRIFALAILGYEEEAVATAKSTMPPDLALQIAPYLRYMRRLTPAQQAAAANLGHFPQAAEIGQDDPRVAQYARSLDRSHLGGADRGLVPVGAPLGKRSDLVNAAGSGTPSDRPRKDKHKSADQMALAASASAGPRGSDAVAGNAAPPELRTSRETLPPSANRLASPNRSASAPSPRSSVLAPLSPPASAPAPAPAPLAQTTPTARAVMGPVLAGQATVLPMLTAPAPRPLAGAARPGPLSAVAFAPSAAVAVQPPAAKPAAPPLLAAPTPHIPRPAGRPSFAEAFAQLSSATADITPEQGAVDVRRIAPARAIAKAPPPPAHPSRIWVELGVGRDPDRMAFDWRRMVKDNPEIFRSRKPFVSSWARTNRLLVGPFETEGAAVAFNGRLHKADYPAAFVWTSPAGQVVDPLDAQ